MKKLRGQLAEVSDFFIKGATHKTSMAGCYVHNCKNGICSEEGEGVMEAHCGIQSTSENCRAVMLNDYLCEENISRTLCISLEAYFR